jgi:hypothetical protein
MNRTHSFQFIDSTSVECMAKYNQYALQLAFMRPYNQVFVDHLSALFPPPPSSHSLSFPPPPAYITVEFATAA